MTSVLLTGATGFIGDCLLPRLCSHNEVIALTRRVPEESTQTNVRWIGADLAQPLLDEKRLPSRIDAIIHLAQSRHYRDFPERANDIFAVNVQSTAALLDYARRAQAQQFILASSGSVYGFGERPFRETDPVNPPNYYAACKYSAELLTRSYQECFACISLRFFTVYGPGQEGMLVPTLLNKVRTGRAITLHGNPGMRINPTYVADACTTIEKALESGENGVYNVAGDEMVTLTDLVGHCQVAAGRKADVEYDHVSNPGDLVGDNRQMKDRLGVHLATSLSAGLRRCYEQILTPEEIERMSSSEANRGSI